MRKDSLKLEARNTKHKEKKVAVAEFSVVNIDVQQLTPVYTRLKAAGNTFKPIINLKRGPDARQRKSRGFYF